jgi:hypothetical protein
VPPSKLLQINKVLGRNFVTKYGTRQGINVPGRIIPFGIGAVIGGAANLALAETTIRASRRAFGPPPEFWDLGVDSLTAKRCPDIAVPLKKRTAVINHDEGDHAKMAGRHDAYQRTRARISLS